MQHRLRGRYPAHYADPASSADPPPSHARRVLPTAVWSRHEAAAAPRASTTSYQQPVTHTLALEKAPRLRPLQQRQCREQSRLRAAASGNRHRAWGSVDGPAGARIQDVAIAHAIPEQEAMRIATGGKRPALHIQHESCVLLEIGALDADLPGAAGQRTADAQIAAEIDQEGL